MAYPNSRDLAEHWTSAAARAQIRWADEGRPPLLTLSEEHAREGRRALAALGIPDGAWYVGLHVREGGFYGDAAGTGNEHRNSDIDAYRGAIEEITRRGGWVIRLGDRSMRQLEPMDRVIDYAHSDHKSPVVDLFLLASSRFIVGTTSGLTTCALSFGTPMVLVNCISSDWQLWTADTDFIVKRMYDRVEKRVLSLGETYRQPLQTLIINAALLRRRGYQPLQNDPEDIRAAVRYKLHRILDERAPPAENDPLMQAYRHEIRHSPNIFGAARPVPDFLARHSELIAGRTV